MTHFSSKYLLSSLYTCLALLTIQFIFFTGLVKAADTVPPVSTLTANPVVPNGENNWYVSYPTINISATDDDSGVRAINWKLNDEPWQRSEFTQGLNVILNPSFEQGYIQYWDFDGPFLSVGYKSSLFERTGNYAASIVTLSPFFKSYWKSTNLVQLVPQQTYTYYFYMASITSFLDNGFYEIISVSGGSETIIASDYDIDLKLNYKQFGGTFVAPLDPNAKIYIKIGLEGLGHLAIDDVYISTASDTPDVSFILNKEGVNSISYFAEDAASNIEGTKTTQVKIDTQNPVFSGFEAFNEESKQKFASRIDVADLTSGLVSDPSLFNYAVDGFTNGYFELINTCEGEFNLDEYIVLDTNFSYGDNSGTVSTPQIDYCDTNWVNCKRLNFYVKDIAGNIGSHSICVNGPYITSKNGNAFARNSFFQMGLGDEDNIYGTVVSGGDIVDISSTIGSIVTFYSQPPYLNNVYSYYLHRLESDANFVNEITTDQGVFILDSNYTISSSINYTDVTQIYFINGDLTIESDILSTNSSVTYLVNGDIKIDNDVSQIDANLIATNQIFTAQTDDLTQRITINGVLISQDLVFNRNTDRTLGASEVISFPIKDYFENSALNIQNIYWQEVVN